MIIAPWLIPSIMAYFNPDEMQCRGFGSLGVTFDPNLKLIFIPFSYILSPFRVAARTRFELIIFPIFLFFYKSIYIFSHTKTCTNTNILMAQLSNTQPTL